MNRRTLFLLLHIVFICSGAQAQSHLKPDADGVVGSAPINIASEKVNKLFVKPPAEFNRLKSASAVETNIDVTYIDFPQEAQQAFEYAVSIWESMITTTVPVKVLAKWESLDGNVLALSRPATFHINFDGAPVSNVYYPVALAEKLSGNDINNGEADIICSFNKKFSWYFGTDGNTPSNRYDFVSSVLHEITHGLGISGFLKDNAGTGFFDNNANLPSIYDYYIFNANNQQISDKSLFNSPSADLHQQLTSDDLKFFRPHTHGEGETVDWVYAPQSWREGASIYHTEGSGYDYGLMTPFAYKGEAIHHPGENTMQILSELGWKSVTFKFDEIKDIEQAKESIPVQIAMLSDLDIDSSSIQVVYSTDYFTTQKNARLSFNVSAKKFTGDITLDGQLGNVQYYFTAKTTDGKTFSCPAQAPQKKFAFRIGPDYSSPELLHNPVKILSASKLTEKITVIASDNLGISSVKLEYKVDGLLQPPLTLHNDYGNNYYTAELPIENTIKSGVKLEYRITAVDNSSRQNKKTLPSSGFFSAEVFEKREPIHSYNSDFENGISDFVLSDFSVSRLPGFSGAVMHTRHPYPVSAIENEKYNLIAQLRSPVILQEFGKMEFDEVVLVEPGEAESDFTDQIFWDYVIVEASKDNGKNWLPISEGYDSGADDTWYSTFNSVVNNNTSVAVGSEDLSAHRTIYLTENKNFSVGDTVLFRFRLASDNSVNGWGWAIDNLKIQDIKTGNNNLTEQRVTVFPNPFVSDFYIDCSGSELLNKAEVRITNLHGKTVYHKSNLDVSFNKKIKVDLSAASPGVYLVNICDGPGIIATNKIVKF